MPKAYRAPYSVAKANRDQKVARWKAIGKFKQAQKRSLREAAEDGASSAIPLPTELPESLRAKKKKRAAVGETDAAVAPRSAQDAAWQKRQRSEAAEAEQRVELQREVAGRQRELADAKRRRKEQTAKLNKRTKRGQPVLSHSIERMLGKLQAE